MKLKITPQKLIALAFVFLMFASSLAYALINAFRNPEESITVPNQKIIDYELNQQQRTFLLQRYYTLVEYRYFTGCMDCISMRNELERITQNSDGQIFLQEIVSTDNATTSLTITSLRGQKILDNPTNEEIEDTICNLLVSQPLWCVTSKI